jgi:hypothetical protein
MSRLETGSECGDDRGRTSFRLAAKKSGMPNKALQQNRGNVLRS